MKVALKFLPLLLVYLVLVFSKPSYAPMSDSTRYVWFAENLARGYYSPKHDLNLWNGPGYPLILAPFAFFKAPWFGAKLLNCVFMIGAVLYFYSMLRAYVPPRMALLIAYILGLWPPALRMVPSLMTEILSIFLVCGFAFHLCRLHRGEKHWRTHLLLASIYMGYLALTRVLFGYVILTGFVVYLALYIWKRRGVFRDYLMVYVFAMLVASPYLVYTYSSTGRIFYWSNSGGLSLYWMASPYKGDFGDWHLPGTLKTNPELDKNHQEFFARIGSLSAVEQDEALKTEALQNIAASPGKFVSNWLANVGRLLFNYPYSYTPQRPSTYLYMLPGMVLSVLSILCIYPTYAARSQIPREIWALLLFGAVSFGGSSLLSAFNRFFLPILPVALLWLGFVLARLVKVKVLR